MAVDIHPLSLFSGICTRASSRTLYSYIGETTSDEEEEEVIYQFTFHQSWPSTGLLVAHPSRAAVGYTVYLYNMYIYFISSRTSIYIREYCIYYYYIYVYGRTTLLHSEPLIRFAPALCTRLAANFGTGPRALS